jgi:hypothetical protein
VKCPDCHGTGKLEEWVPFNPTLISTDVHLGQDTIFDICFSED